MRKGINVVISEQEAGMTIAEFREYHDLNKKLMNGNMFVEVDWCNPEWRRFNNLSRKYQQYLRKEKLLIAKL